MGDQNLPDDFLMEEMKNEFMGIFVKCFTVFYLENIHFYITEEDEEGQAIIIESYNIQLDHEIQLEEDTKYNHLNYMANLGYINKMSLRFDRRFRYRGSVRSYFNARCAAPTGFQEAIFTFARGRFVFDNGQRLTTPLTRSCRVR
jgi:hypothetical protein